MKIYKSRRLYLNLIISFIISLTMVLPMILGMMGYDIFNRRQVPEPSRIISLWEVTRLWFFFFMMFFILLVINTIQHPRVSGWYKAAAGLAVTVIFYFLFTLVTPAPPSPGQFRFRPGQPGSEIHDPRIPETEMQKPRSPFPGQPQTEASRSEMQKPNSPGSEIQPRPPFPGQQKTGVGARPFRPFGLDYLRMIEFLFIFLITTLIGKVYELVNVKQDMQLENEQLRSENLQNRYDVLLNQINPHFFFNSLNSLSSLVRDGRSESALRYIDELSNTYRYAMQSSGKELVTVTEELESLNAYSYLLQIRFEDKLFIDINIAPEAMRMLLPVLSLQPLIENVVKHNVISIEWPLTITITGSREGITVINPIRLRNTSGEKSGTGLKNLSTRYHLLTGKNLLIGNGGNIFSVTLPLINPDEV